MSFNIDNILESFITDIIKVFPEYEKRLLKHYINVLNKENSEDLINSFFENIDDISKNLSENDFSVFDKDPIILNNVSFKLIWSSNISIETKNNIWRYLQTLSICSLNRKIGEEDVQETLKSLKENEKIDKHKLKDIKLIKKLSECLKSNSSFNILKNEDNNHDINEDKNENLKNISIDDKNIKGMEDILENSNIGKIAKEVSEELNIESMITGEGGIENLMDTQNMMNIFKSISEKIDLNQEGDIVKEAMDISENMKDNPLFSSLMSNMSQGLSTNNLFNVPQNDNRKIDLSNTHDGNSTKKRLQKKLKEKNENKIDVNKKD